MNQKDYRNFPTIRSKNIILNVAFGPRLGTGGAMGSDPYELAPGFEACQMKGTHIDPMKLAI